MSRFYLVICQPLQIENKVLSHIVENFHLNEVVPLNYQYRILKSIIYRLSKSNQSLFCMHNKKSKSKRTVDDTTLAKKGDYNFQNC